MDDNDLTVAILREIRDEIRTTRMDLGSEIRGTNQRITETNNHLAETNQRLEVVETTLGDFAGQHLLLTRYVKNVVDRHSDAIEDLRERVTKLEAPR